jgi:hypothetical protein
VSNTGDPTTLSATADSTGGISYAIPVSTLNGIYSAKLFSLSAVDNTTGDASNTVVINVSSSSLSPKISTSSGVLYYNTASSQHPGTPTSITISGSGFIPNSTANLKIGLGWNGTSYSTGSWQTSIGVQTDSNGDLIYVLTAATVHGAIPASPNVDADFGLWIVDTTGTNSNVLMIEMDC